MMFYQAPPTCALAMSVKHSSRKKSRSLCIDDKLLLQMCPLTLDDIIETISCQINVQQEQLIQKQKSYTWLTGVT